jgi:D-alanyl-D-alanine carboxypeptidase
LKRIIFILILTCSFQIGYSQEKKLIGDLAVYLKELGKDSNFSLSIAVSKGDKTLYHAAYGFANREHQLPNKVDTRYNIASIGKMFTSVAVLQLQEQHKIGLKDKVGRYLPSFPNAYIRDSVTIHQLLSHSSGLPVWFSSSFAGGTKFQYQELNDYLPFYERIAASSEKRDKFSYSNVGYMVLGYVIEEVSGISYKEYLQRNIFQPLHMDHTGLWRLTEIIPASATGYMRPESRNDWWKTNYHRNMSSSPAGGAYATVADLSTFMIALKEHRLLNATTSKLMLSPQVSTGDGAYGYGCMIDEHNGHHVLGHAGEFFGIRGSINWFKEDDITVAILSNDDQTDYNDVSYFLQVQITGTDAERTVYANTQRLLQKVRTGVIVPDGSNLQSLKAQPLDEELINIKAYYFLNNNLLPEAIALFRLNTILFPDSPGVKDRLAVAEKRQQ